MFPYNPDDVLVTLGSIELDDFATDSIIMIEYDEQAVTKTVGAKGQVAATVNANKSGKATFRLMQGSPINKALTKLSAQTAGRLIVKPFTMTDLQSNTLVKAAEAWIQKTANLERAKDHKDREWVIELAKIVIVDN